MVQSQFSLTWESFKSNVCGGFSSLQQNGELVDMTLAADGHHVKVHQVLMALVSPYLKELIISAPCQHPVLFLNNVSHNTLRLLLEYVYTGEVMVPSENLTSFVQAAKNLHIKGLENLTSSHNVSSEDTITQQEESVPRQISGVKRLAVSTDSTEISVPTSARQVVIKRPKTSYSPVRKQLQLPTNPKDDTEDYSIQMLDDTDDDAAQTDNVLETIGAGDYKDPSNQVSKVQFSVSIRGSLQVILNRYIYNLHSTQHRSGVRRWRCVNYRNNRCQAFLVTNGNLVLNRANLHNHPFHDKKILQKIEKKAVFSAIEEVVCYQETVKEPDTEGVADKEYSTSFDETIAGDSKQEQFSEA